jgi:hypothetical protein
MLQLRGATAVWVTFQKYAFAVWVTASPSAAWVHVST